MRLFFKRPDFVSIELPAHARTELPAAPSDVEVTDTDVIYGIHFVKVSGPRESVRNFIADNWGWNEVNDLTACGEL